MLSGGVNAARDPRIDWKSLASGRQNSAQKTGCRMNGVRGIETKKIKDKYMLLHFMHS